MSTPTEIETSIQRCTQAWHKALAAKKVTDILAFDAIDQRYAGRAYRNAMPYLTGPDAIDAFIACVAHGMVIGAILPHDGTKLLYAAQVATGACRARKSASPQPNPEPVQTTPPTPSNGRVPHPDQPATPHPPPPMVRPQPSATWRNRHPGWKPSHWRPA